jgi:tetratricopeptide (TPR) repeat protein
MGKGSDKKIRVKWTNLPDPNEFEYGCNHSIFKDPSAPPRQKAQKIVHQSQIAPFAGGFITAGSNESDVVELHPSSPEVSDAEDEAGNAIFTAVKYFEQDSFNLALNGDGQNSGFLELADEFSGTKAGNLCNYYIAVSYLRQGNANEAYSFFDAFDKGENFLSVSAYSAMASIKEDQSDLEGAAEYYEKAASIKANSSTTPFLWQQAARCYETAENKDAALKLYLRIKNEYPSSTEAQQVDKYIARISPDDLDSEI